MNIRILLTICFLSFSPLAVSSGLIFQCEAPKLLALQSQINAYLKKIGVSENIYETKIQDKQLQYQLKNIHQDTSTLYLRWNPELNIQEEKILLPSSEGFREVSTVSKKEIILALMQLGRQTTFKGPACHFEALEDHIHVRQMIVAWAENLEWKFPDGNSAKWNEAYWNEGTLKPGKPILEAMTDFFINPNQCSVGCYTATKIVMIQGVLDYYQRIKKDFDKANQIKKTLRSDGEVLVGIEPESMWHFLNKDKNTRQINGKLLTVQRNVAPLNFIPGDWVYFINTDEKSSNIPGYEGSNSIYMGRARFDDFYNDNGHYYFYHEKLKEVYNWRHGVFSRSRDYEKIQPLSSNQLHTLGLPPKHGGLILDTRSSPRLFWFE